MDSPWDENPDDTTFRDVEWSRISSDFTNAGYREGITAGKEAASQEGFDVGYATVGVPLGRQLGLLRGISSVLLSFFKDATDADAQGLLAEAQDIASQLARVRFSDIVPRDLEAEQHAREHLEAEGVELDGNEEVARRRELEGIEDMLANLGSAKPKGESGRPTMNDINSLKSRLNVLNDRLNLGIDGMEIIQPSPHR